MMKDSGVEWIGEIPVDWEIVKIKMGVTKVGSGKTPSGGADSYADEGILFLRSQNVYDTGLVLDEPTFITSDVDESMKGTRVYPQDVLLNITGGSIGRCCIFPDIYERANVNQHVSIIRVVKNVFYPEYMHYYWMSSLGHTAIDLYQTGGNREGMSAEAIKNSPIPLIPLEEQREIIAYLDIKCIEIDKLISFDGDYVSYNRRMKVIDNVPYCNTMKFVTYHIDYIEDGEENLWRPFIHFVIVKQWQGAEQALQVILAEKKLADAKYALGSSCSRIHVTF